MDESTDTPLGIQELPATSPDRQGDEQRRLSSSPKSQNEAPTEAAKFPSVKSPPLPTDGRFGVVSSTGQLVCEFKTDDISATAVPEERITVPPSPSLKRKPLGESISPPPQGNNEVEVTPSSSTVEDVVVSASNLEIAVDHDSYPEVYVPADEHEATPLPQSSSYTMHSGSPPPPSSTSGEFIKTGYLENNSMSMSNPIDVPLVTPLHMLGDQSDTVDCPFCMKRVETMVVKKSSQWTHIWGTICFCSTVIGAPIPYYRDWYKNLEHHCQNCKRKIAHRRYNAGEYEALGTPLEHRTMSRFEPAEPTEKEKKRWFS
ncbi:hypothetical protein VPNG_02564 [Cytospora leucostoma]|uniref:LITAF domain-containing protein n=1 Tax=Cytospora leucostoma TaxID=1230097 RepID=A0A423XI31_9PEZI|nr:hypothetical protein VPNG_02564 [Cytospora leucostoma]